MDDERLARWLAVTTVGTDVERFGLRRAAVQDVLPGLSRKHVILAAKIFLGYSTSSSELSRFRAAFLKRDPFFAQKNNLHELRVLAGLIMAECWERPTQSDPAIIGALIVWSGLTVTSRPLIVPEVQSLLECFLRDRALDARKLQLVRAAEGVLPGDAIRALRRLHKSLDSAEASLRRQTYQDGLEQLIRVVEHVQKSHESVVRNQLVLQEETNILWLQKRLRNERPASNLIFSDCFDVASQLASLHEILPPLPSSAELLRTMMPVSSGDAISLATAIGAVGRELREAMLQGQATEEAAKLCPILGHVAASLEVNEGDEYLPLVRQRFGGELPPMVPADIASCIFNELVLLRALAREFSGGGDAQVL